MKILKKFRIHYLSLHNVNNFTHFLLDNIETTEKLIELRNFVNFLVKEVESDNEKN